MFANLITCSEHDLLEFRVSGAAFARYRLLRLHQFLRSFLVIQPVLPSCMRERLAICEEGDVFTLRDRLHRACVISP